MNVSSDEASPAPTAGAYDLLGRLADFGPDGRPHSAGVRATWVDSALYFVSGPGPAQAPAPWHLYRLTLHTAVGVATAEPHGATRWVFAH